MVNNTTANKARLTKFVFIVKKGSPKLPWQKKTEN